MSPAIDYPVAAVEAAESYHHFSPRQVAIESDDKPSLPIRQTFRFNKRILQIEPGQLQLKLVEPLEVAVDSDTLECEVLGWDVRLPALQAEEIPSAMARRFLELFSKADQRCLSEAEQTAWVDILDRVDFQAFCIDRAQPHYMEGQIVSKQPHQVRVEWHDGGRENIPSPVCRPLMNLKPGDEFGAWVKLGRDERALRIENLSFLAGKTA